MGEPVMHYWRAHHGAPTDAKWLLVADRAAVRVSLVVAVAWALMDFASQQRQRGNTDGFDVESLAAYLREDPADIERILQEMRRPRRDGRPTLIGPDGNLSSWNRYNPIREDPSAADRKRAQRERDRQKREDGHVASRSVTRGHSGVVTSDQDVSSALGRSATGPKRRTSVPSGGAEESCSGNGLNGCHARSRAVTPRHVIGEENPLPSSFHSEGAATARPLDVLPSASIRPKKLQAEPSSPGDAKKAVFDLGVALLTSSGSRDRQARGMVAKWRKEHGEAALAPVLLDCQRLGITDPIAWITKALKQRAGPERVAPARGYDPIADLAGPALLRVPA